MRYIQILEYMGRFFRFMNKRRHAQTGLRDILSTDNYHVVTMFDDKVFC